MDKKNFDIEKEIEKTLESAESIQRVEGNHFLFTRIEERLRQKQQTQKLPQRSFSPTWSFAVIVLLFFVNGFVLIQSGYFENTTENVASIDDLATEYSLSASVEDLDYYQLNE